MATLGVSIVFIVLLSVMLAVAIFVFFDSKSRNMNSIVWALIAFFGPFLLGVLIYFICRTPLSDLQCPKCGKSLNKDERMCSNCGTVITTVCPQCKFPISRGWSSCPNCGSQLPENYVQPVKAYKKDYGTKVVVGVIIVAMLVIGSISLFVYNEKGSKTDSFVYGSNVGVYNITEDDLSKNDILKEWIDKSNDSKKDVHVIMSTKSNTCYLYIKNNTKLLTSNVSIDTYSDGNEGITIDINKTVYDDLYGYDFYMYSFEVTDDKKIVVNLNDKKQKAEVTIVDTDISEDTWREE